MVEFDKGPTQRFAKLFDECPDFGALKAHFWYDWGPIFYRGRLDGSARVLCIASDPGATERIAGRTLVGDAGQRVQGFLRKIGLTRSYLCLNAYAYALIPSQANDGAALLVDPPHKRWRNRVFNAAHTAHTQAIVAFGEQAQRAVALWSGKGATPVFEVPHPSSRDEQKLVTEWKQAVIALRAIVTPDDDAGANPANYGNAFGEGDYAPIPRRDLPYGVPPFLGDDSAGRAAVPARRSSVSRPKPDDRHTLVWIAPQGS